MGKKDGKFEDLLDKYCQQKENEIENLKIIITKFEKMVSNCEHEIEYLKRVNKLQEKYITNIEKCNTDVETSANIDNFEDVDTIEDVFQTSTGYESETLDSSSIKMINLLEDKIQGLTLLNSTLEKDKKQLEMNHVAKIELY